MTGHIVNLSEIISVNAGFREIQRLRRPRIGHAVLNENSRFMDMSQSDIGERHGGKTVFVKRKMLCISSMEHEDFVMTVLRNGEFRSQILRDLRRMIAETVDFRVQIL